MTGIGVTTTSFEENVKVKTAEQKIMKDTTQIKHSVEFLNGASSNSTIKGILEKIEKK